MHGYSYCGYPSDQDLVKETREFDISYTRDTTRLGLRNQKLNTLYALWDSDFAGGPLRAWHWHSWVNFWKFNYDESRSNFMIFWSSDNDSTKHSSGWDNCTQQGRCKGKVFQSNSVWFDQPVTTRPTNIDSTTVWVKNTQSLPHWLWSLVMTVTSHMKQSSMLKSVSYAQELHP